MTTKKWIDLNDKVVIVTGGSMGIGDATSKIATLAPQL